MPDTWSSKIYENQHDIINEFLRSKKTTGKSERTLNEYSRILQKFYHEHFPDLDPTETQVAHVEEYVHILDERDCSQNTKRRYVESLSSFFDWAYKRPRYDVPGNPAAVVLEELPRNRPERPEVATWENGKRIIECISDPRDKTVAVLMAKSGARVSEVLDLQFDDLMLDSPFHGFEINSDLSDTPH